MGELRRLNVRHALFGVVVLFSIPAISVYASEKEFPVPLETVLLSPLDLLGHPIRFSVVSSSPSKTDSFVSALAESNKSNDLVRASQNSTLQDVDAHVYLIEEWSDVRKLPGQNLIGGLVEELEKRSETDLFIVRNIKPIFRSMPDQPKDVYLFFFPVGYHQETPEWPECYAKWFYDYLTIPPLSQFQTEPGSHPNIASVAECLFDNVVEPSYE